MDMRTDAYDRMIALEMFDQEGAFELKIVEELMELALCMIHIKDEKTDVLDLAKEVADVEFQIEKIKHLYRNENLKEKVLVERAGILNHIDKLTGRIVSE